ncbi:MAG: 2-C-methyl-D-erythritol 4-phosphate cytidylyltransferase [Phenylobacterium sp.]|jgi:2-C-methyl-D-erythritol 4-phosphate cytidylyltransferase
MPPNTLSTQSIRSPDDLPQIYCVIPAAGVGKRMQANHPKQYLTIDDKTIIEHTVTRLQQLPFISKIVIAISPGDQYFADLSLASDKGIQVVDGGLERVDSVLAGLTALAARAECAFDAWVLVHDAARPNVSCQDIEKLVRECLAQNKGGILATPVKDTMKRGAAEIEHTESRENLWHALTPQFFRLRLLIEALTSALADGVNVTDEASAVEHQNQPVLLVEGRADNIKITRPEDLALTSFYLRNNR